MIGNDKFVSVFGGVPAGDDTLLTQIVANAVREGFHIVLCAPGAATPVCTLPAGKQKQDHECGTAHVLSLESVIGERNPDDPWYAEHGGLLVGNHWSPKDKAKVRAKVQAVINRVTKQYDGVKPNIGVIPGPSGYVAGMVALDDPAITVRCTGIDEVGYAWFVMPENAPVHSLDLQPVLVPPSRVPRGPYEIIGQTSPAPAWLLERISQ